MGLLANPGDRSIWLPIDYIPTSSRPKTLDAPEKKLTLFALQLVALEKISNGFRTLGFVWATVVLLGGYAIILSRTDFWFVTIILLSEGVIILSGRHGIQFPQQSSWTIASAGLHYLNALKSRSLYFIQALKGTLEKQSSVGEKTKLLEVRIEAMPSDQSTSKRTWESSEVPLLPYTGGFFGSRPIGKLVHSMQLSSALACMSLSVIRLVRLSHADAIEATPESMNERYALIIFYGLSLAQAFSSLLEKVYWEWTIACRGLLEEVNKDCELGSLISIKRFFFDAYSACLNGSIFDGLKLDLISFATGLLASNSNDELLTGTQILLSFSTNPNYSDDTLGKIAKSTSVIERLMEMLSWKNQPEAEIRRAAAKIVSALAGSKHNYLRLAGIPGAIKSISSLLYTLRSTNSTFDEISEKKIVWDLNNSYEFSDFNMLGLTILCDLARDQDNCELIAKTRGLLPKIIDFTRAREALFTYSSEGDIRISAVRRSLQLLKSLSRTSGPVGDRLRRDIVETVFTISNISEILKYGGERPRLQHLGIEILTGLAFDVADARERIGSTGGIITELIRIFFQEQDTKDQNNVRVAAGEAIAVLALDNNENCSRILKQEAVLTKLVHALEHPVLGTNSARILRHLWIYMGENCSEKLQGVSQSAAPIVLKAIMLEENKLQEVITNEKQEVMVKLQEVMLGLATRVFRFMTLEEASIAFKQVGIDEAKLAEKLLQILKIYKYPSAKVPRMRRFAIELAILMMNKNKATIQTFRDLGMVEELKIMGETTSEIESFNIFCRTIGLRRDSTAIHSLVESALELLADG